MRKIKGGIITLVFLISLVAAMAPVSAADWHVYPDQSIQIAINNASSGDTIYVHAGTYNETDLTINGKSLSLIGDGASTTTIDGSTSPGVNVLGPATVNISGFTVKGFLGIMYQSSASGMIKYNTIMAYIGNGILIFDATTTVIITSNTITGSSSGIVTSGAGTTIINNTIKGNTLHGITVTATAANTVITGNTITGQGGDGIDNSCPGIRVISNTITGNFDGIFSMVSATITGNTVTGINNDSIDTWDTSIITNNVITGSGAVGIRNSGTGTTITNNIITGSGAWGIGDFGPGTAILHNTITGSTQDGILSLHPAPATTMTNNIISSNGGYGINVGFAPAVCTYNDVWGNTLGNYGGSILDQTGINGNISLNPQFMGFYHLSALSPCIDAGTNAGVYDDIDGEGRPVGSGFDMGADEYVPPFVNPGAAFMPVKNYHLAQVNQLLLDIEELLPDDVPGEIQELLDEAQSHIDNANITGNTIYANNELLKARELLKEVLSSL